MYSKVYTPNEILLNTSHFNQKTKNVTMLRDIISYR